MHSPRIVPGKGPAPTSEVYALDPPLSPMAQAAAEVPWAVHAIAASTPVAITMAYFSASLFSVHVACMAFAFLLVLPEGIILAVQAVRHRNRVKMMRLHMYLQLAALVLSMAGLMAQFWRRHKQGKAHFKGLHSWLGVATLLGTQMVSSVGLLLFYWIPKAKRLTMPRVVASHQLGGRLVFLLAICTILEALKIFDTHHKRNKGWITYVMASAVVAQAVGMHTVLWPSSGYPTRPLRSPGRDRMAGGVVERKPLVVVLDHGMEDADMKKEKD